jgi:LysR family transcriptional regulator, regulator for bpeEF and oprC
MTEIATWMRSFVTVADMGNFSLAANRLQLTQSTISKQIVALEKHLGTRLLQRTTRSLGLTQEGTAFYESALGALAAIDEAEASVGLRGDIHGIVRVTVPLTLAEARLISMIGKFLEENPRIEIDLQLSDHQLNLVADNLDIAIRVGRLGDSGLVARSIGVAQRVIVASPAYLDRMGRPQKPVDLSDHNCMSYSLLGSGTRWQFVGGETVAIKGNFRADSPHALRAGAIAGVGIAVNARWLFERQIETGELEVVLPDHEPEPMPIHAVLPSGRYVSARTRTFLEFLVKAFADDPLLSVRPRA